MVLVAGPDDAGTNWTEEGERVGLLLRVPGGSGAEDEEEAAAAADEEEGYSPCLYWAMCAI